MEIGRRNAYAFHSRYLRLVSLAGVVGFLGDKHEHSKTHIAVDCGDVYLFAQADRGSIEGTVKDPNGAVVPGAKVQVVNIETNSKLDFSDQRTRDTTWHANLPVGSYRMIVQKEGFRTLVREPILVRAQSSLAVDFTFQIGAVTDTVTVSEEAPLLDISATTNPSNLTVQVHRRSADDRLRRKA